MIYTIKFDLVVGGGGILSAEEIFELLATKINTDEIDIEAFEVLDVTELYHSLEQEG